MFPLAVPRSDYAAPSLSLGEDITYLVLEHIDSYKDLRNLCLVSKAAYSVATLRLHRRIVFKYMRPKRRGFGAFFAPNSLFPQENIDDDSGPQTSWDYIQPLITRLVDGDNVDLRNAVREVEIGDSFDTPVACGIWKDLDSINALPRLVQCLPNLRQFITRSCMPLTDEFIDTLCNHKNKPELHLLNERQQRDIEKPMPCVKTIHASVDPFTEPRTYSSGNPFNEGNNTRYEPNENMPKVQRLFFASQNLRSFSIQVYGNFGGCIISRPQFPQIHNFQLTGSETFPPLENLSLNGYRFGQDEWPHWRKKFHWAGLRSLSLGPQNCEQSLSLLNGQIFNLKVLKIEKYADEGYGDILPELDTFLKSFGTLESLTVKGYSISMDSTAWHPNLKHFCMHTIESPYQDDLRRTLGPMELYDLDINCPNLENLELDINRDGEWPEDIIGIMAMGFKSLRRLALHFEIGLQNLSNVIETSPLFQTPMYGIHDEKLAKPVLVENSAKEIGQMINSSRSASNLRLLILKTGESLRRFPQWRPPYANWETQQSRSYEVYLPSNTSDELQVKELPQHSKK